MRQEKNERELLAEISAKLDQVIAVMATHGKSVEEQIDMLHKLGRSAKEIGVLVGMKPGTVKKRLERKAKKKK